MIDNAETSNRTSLPFYNAETDTIVLNEHAPWYRPTGKRNKYDWKMLTQLYIEHPDPVNIWSFCREQGFPNYELISTHARDEKWNLSRELFWKRVHEERVESSAHAIADVGREWDEACRVVAQRILDRVNEELDGRDVQVVLKDGTVTLVHQEAAAKDVAGAAKTAQEIGKAALGDVTRIDVTGFIADWGAPSAPRKKEEE